MQRTLLPPSSENLKPYITLKEPRFYAMCITHMKNNRSFTETHLKNQYTYFHISTLLYLYLTLSVPAKNVIEYVFLLLTQNKLFHSL